MIRIYLILAGLSAFCLGIGVVIVWPEILAFRIRRRASRRKGWLL